MVSKKGISAIVATVLIILITIAAVTIIWVAIIPMIKDNLNVIDADARVNVVSTGGYTIYDPDQNYLSVKVARTADEENMVGMDIIVLFADGSYSAKVTPPEPNQEKVYVFDLTLTGHIDPLSVSVAPIFQKGGIQQTATASSSVEILESPIINIPTELLELSSNSKAVLCPGGTDEDSDGYGGGCNLGADCDDSTSSINPGATELCYDNIDNDCDGKVDNCIGTGLISYWKAENNVEDSFGANDGTWIGTEEYATGHSGQGLSLDGATDYISILDSTDFDLGQGLTISAWIKPAAIGAQMILDHSSDFRLLAYNGGRVRVYNSTTVRYCGVETAMTAGEWYHLAGTYDGTNLKIYSNGNLINTCPHTGDIRQTDTELLLGYKTRGGGTYFNGTLDEVMLFDRALTLTEIQTLAGV